jgi:hypothetical protein
MAKPKAEKHENRTIAIDRKWFKSRMDDLGLDRDRVARALDVKSYIVTRIVVGERPVRLDEIPIISKVLEVHPVELLRRLGVDVPSATVPVIGAMRGSGRVTLWPADRIQRADSPRQGGGELVGLRIETAHSPLGLHDGGVLFFEPTTRVEHGSWSRLSVIELGDEASPIVGTLDRGASVRSCRVLVFGGHETIESEQLQSAAPILWHRFG